MASEVDMALPLGSVDLAAVLEVQASNVSMTDLIDLVATSSLVSVTLKEGMARLTDLLALKAGTTAFLEAVALMKGVKWLNDLAAISYLGPMAWL